MPLTIPPIRNAEDRFDAISLLLTQCSEDELADLAFGIVEGKFGNQSDRFVDDFADALTALDTARAEFARRHDQRDAMPSMWGVHPDDPRHGARMRIFGRKAA